MTTRLGAVRARPVVRPRVESRARDHRASQTEKGERRADCLELLQAASFTATGPHSLMKDFRLVFFCHFERSRRLQLSAWTSSRLQAGTLPFSVRLAQRSPDIHYSLQCSPATPGFLTH